MKKQPKTTKLQSKQVIKMGPKITTMPTTAFLKLMSLIEELYEVKNVTN